MLKPPIRVERIKCWFKPVVGFLVSCFLFLNVCSFMWSYVFCNTYRKNTMVKTDSPYLIMVLFVIWFRYFYEWRTIPWCTILYKREWIESQYFLRLTHINFHTPRIYLHAGALYFILCEWTVCFQIWSQKSIWKQEFYWTLLLLK